MIDLVGEYYVAIIENEVNPLLLEWKEFQDIKLCENHQIYKYVHDMIFFKQPEKLNGFQIDT